MSGFFKFLGWLFAVASRHQKEKANWQSRGEGYKILKVLLVLFLVMCSVGLSYLTVHLVTLLSDSNYVKIYLLIIFAIFVLAVISIVLAVNVFEVLLSLIIVAFTCRNPRKQKAPETEVIETENGTAEITKEATPKSQTSRGFDTFIGILGIFLLVAYTLGVGASIAIALTAK